MGRIRRGGKDYEERKVEECLAVPYLLRCYIFKDYV